MPSGNDQDLHANLENQMMEKFGYICQNTCVVSVWILSQMVPEKNIQCWSLFYETRFPAVFYQKQQPNQGFSKQTSKVMRVFHDMTWTFNCWF